MDVKLIRAFIASPSGLEGERRAAYAAAKEINRAVAMPLGGRLELIGWEETLSGNGRPQAVINLEMETCDLFIGAIWTSWGSKPSIDGPYSSGFEEEFELSQQRYVSTGSPQMAMFFKEVDEQQLRDPGKDLRKVLDFQEKLRAEKSLLYSSFTSPDDFASKVRTFLSTHVINELRQKPERQEARPVQTSSTKGEAAAPASHHDRAVASEAKFLSDAAVNITSDTSLNPVEIARMRLITVAHGGDQNDKHVLGVHDANLIYFSRDLLSLSDGEEIGLLEAGLAHIRDENVPVWTWLAHVTSKRPLFLLRISFDSEPSAQAGAIEALRMLQTSVPEKAHELVETTWLGNDSPSSVKTAALRYLRDLGSTTHQPLVQRELEIGSSDTATLALEAAVSIALRSGPQVALKYVLGASFETMDAELLRKVLEELGQATAQQLEAGLDHRSAQVRSKVIEEMANRGTVSLQTLGRAQADGAAIVRLAALQALDRIGQSPSFDEARKIMSKPRQGTIFGLGAVEDTVGINLFGHYAIRRMRTMPSQVVEQFVENPDLKVSAYQALAARRISNYDIQMRDDLANGYEKFFKETWPDGIKPVYTGLLSFRVGSEEPERSKKLELIRQALDIVCAHLDVKDLSLVREVLDNTGVSPTSAVIVYLKNLGDSSDISRIAKTLIYRSTWGYEGGHDSEFNDAARLILKLHEAPPSVLLEMELPIAMKARLVKLMSNKAFSSLSDDEAVQLLLTDDESLRREVARRVSFTMSRRRVDTILSKYRSHEDGRFYLVTHWLDAGLALDRTAARNVASANKR